MTQLGCHGPLPPRPQFDGTVRWMENPFIEPVGTMDGEGDYVETFPDALTPEELKSFLAWVKERMEEWITGDLRLGLDGNYPHTEAMEILFKDGFLLALVEDVSESKPNVVLLSIGVWEERHGWRCGVVAVQNNSTRRFSTRAWGFASRGENDPEEVRAPGKHNMRGTRRSQPQ